MLNGRQLTGVNAHGKHLLYDWDGKTLHIHLGLYGRFRRHRLPMPDPRGQVRLRIVGSDAGFDLNGPAACELLTRPQREALLNRLGEDPLRPDADPEKVWNKIQRCHSPIGTLLINQNVIAGVGNIYRAEVLHLLNMHPGRSCSTLSRTEFETMWQQIVRLMKIGRRYNRIIIADPADAGKPRSRMNRQERLLVYRKPFCSRCEAPVESWKLGGRTIYACPVCQPAAD